MAVGYAESAKSQRRGRWARRRRGRQHEMLASTSSRLRAGSAPLRVSTILSSFVMLILFLYPQVTRLQATS